jgi:hypothetical protein
MANIISEKTVGNILILQVDDDPSVSPGVEATEGSLATVLGVGSLWQKRGILDTDWYIILAGTATPLSVGSSNAEGSATSAARSDHVHAHGDQAGGSLHAVATDLVAGFMSAADKTKLDSITIVPVLVYANTVLATAFAGNPLKATVTFTTSLPSTNYSITISSADVRVWTFSNRTTAGFVINSNSAQSLTGEVAWQVIMDYMG